MGCIIVTFSHTIDLCNDSPAKNTMTQGTSIPQNRESQSAEASGRLGRRQVEDALKRALDTGAVAIPQQLRYLLALCQMSTEHHTTTPYTAKPMSVVQARLSALESLSGVLNDRQVRALLRDIEKIQDINIRTMLLARVAIFIDPKEYQNVVRDIWQQSEYIGDIVVRTRAIYQIAPLLTLINDEPATATPLLNILRLAEAIENTEARLRSLVSVASHLPYDVSIRTFQRVLDELERAGNDSLRVKTLIAMAQEVPDELVGQALNIAGSIRNPTERARTLTALAQVMPTDLRPRLRQDALEAITMIESDDDKAEALIAFAPHLDFATDREKFPAIVTKALAIAIGISRRHVRAKVLVAISPHLTTDLQGEALAAVHSLSNEQDRAMLLAELAPNLPPNMLVASLAVAHTMVSQDARVHALTALAHYVPESARHQTVRDALAAASNLPHYLERVTALVDLADLLPPDLLEQALSNALESAKSIENANAQARALNQLGNYLPETLLEQALELAINIEDANQRLNAIIGIMPNLMSEDRQREARESLVKCAEQMRLEFKQARALVTILPHLTQDMLKPIEEMADGYFDPFDKVSVYLAIAQNSPPENRPSLIGKAWTRLQHIEDGYDRASMIAAMAPFLPERAGKDLASAVESAINIIQDDYDKASAIRILVPLLSSGSNGNSVVLPDTATALERGIETAVLIPDQALRAEYLSEGIKMWVNIHDKERSFNLWRKLVWQFQALPLADVLLCLASVMPLIYEIADKETIIRVAEVLGIRNP